MVYLCYGDGMKKVMKLILKSIGYIFLTIYIVIAIFLTVCLLNYNDYSVTELMGNSFILVRDEELMPDFKKGDLVIVKKNNNDDILVGDKIFFYEAYNKKMTINLGNVVSKEKVNRHETTFVLSGDYALSSEKVIGKSSTAKVYPNLGYVLAFLESKFGFLFVIIFPILIIFIYEMFIFIKEFKSKDDED